MLIGWIQSSSQIYPVNKHFNYEANADYLLQETCLAVAQCWRLV